MILCREFRKTLLLQAFSGTGKLLNSLSQCSTEIHYWPWCWFLGQRITFYLKNGTIDYGRENNGRKEKGNIEKSMRTENVLLVSIERRCNICIGICYTLNFLMCVYICIHLITLIVHVHICAFTSYVYACLLGLIRRHVLICWHVFAWTDFCVLCVHTSVHVPLKFTLR